MTKRGLLTPWRASEPEVLESPGRLARPPATPHHGLTVTVALRMGTATAPVGAAQVVVRPMPLGEVREGEPIARGTTGADGSVALLLPSGRYTVTAAHGRVRRRVLVTVERAGRVLVTLDAAGAPLATLTVEARSHDGSAAGGVPVEARLVRSGQLAARATTDARGAAALLLPQGEYEVRAAEAATRLRVVADAEVRLALPPPAPTPPVLPYLRRVRAAQPYAQPFDREAVDDDLWN